MLLQHPRGQIEQPVLGPDVAAGQGRRSSCPPQCGPAAGAATSGAPRHPRPLREPAARPRYRSIGPAMLVLLISSSKT
ncbi:MAG: hypothetical protein ABR615_10220 [Pseudonocardiaceae bacterium]